MDTEILMKKVRAFLEEKKAEDITTIDMKNRSSIAEYMIIASGTSQRHLAALADNLREEMHKYKIKPLSIEGYPDSDWILVDLNAVIIHLFKPEMRALYDLEKMWMHGEEVFLKKRKASTVSGE